MRKGTGALSRGLHGDGEVAAARMAGVAWRREGRSSAREGGRRGVWAPRVGAMESRRCPAAIHGGGRHLLAPAAEQAEEQGGRR